MGKVHPVVLVGTPTCLRETVMNHRSDALQGSWLGDCMSFATWNVETMMGGSGEVV